MKLVYDPKPQMKIEMVIPDADTGKDTALDDAYRKAVNYVTNRILEFEPDWEAASCDNDGLVNDATIKFACAMFKCRGIPPQFNEGFWNQGEKLLQDAIRTNWKKGLILIEDLGED